MNNQLLYLSDPRTLEFDTIVTESFTLPDGRAGVILERSYFYPTGGGQEHDTGTVGEARVVEVTKDEEQDRVVHVVDRAVALGPVHATIDPDRRLRNRQHHTAQHLLTACFLQVTGLDTLSTHINGYSPSTLDLPYAALDAETLRRVEDLANAVVYEDRPVQAFFVTPEELENLHLRRAPKVSEDIRIVEIAGMDITPCGGTHCETTGEIGLVKLWKTERPNKDVLRVQFSAGKQAFETLREDYETVSTLANQFGAAPRDVLGLAQRQAEQLRDAQASLQALEAELVMVEAHRMGENAEQIGSRRAVLASFTGRPVQQLRALAGELRAAGDLLAVLSTYDGEKLSLVVVCPPGSPVTARELLARLLALTGGRGGGDALLAQGGGAAAQEQAESFPTQARELLEGTL